MPTKTDNLVVAGDVIGDVGDHGAGDGVCERKNKLIATLTGIVSSDKPVRLGKKPTLRVTATVRADRTSILPEVGSVVTCKVLSVNPRSAHLEILVVDGKPLRDMFKGTIRQQDVRRTETDKVELYKCFWPNDIVRAEVISLGDRHSYFLSTAKNELGVIFARSHVGVPMIPHSWQQMVCPETKAREFRKVAKQDSKHGNNSQDLTA